jgi:primosomal protein N' (replication factor Y)
MNSVAGILLDSQLPQLDHLFDYAVPERLQSEIAIGQRVRVPLRGGRRRAFGWVISLTNESSFSGTLTEVSELVSPIPLLQPEVWELVRQVADRAAGSASDVLRLAIPNRHQRAERKFLERQAAATQNEEQGNSSAAGSPTTDGGDAAFEHDTEASAVAQKLIGGARLAFTESHGPIRLKNGEWIGGWAKRLTDIAEAVYAAGHSVIICAPDYRDLDQIRAALSVPVTRVDAKQSNEERYREFLEALTDTPRVIVGNRSAVYAPAYKLGAILMWDDGDPLFSEPRAPYVHCRDAALIRAEQQGAGLMFFAHARTTDVQRLIDIGYVQRQSELPKRVRVRHADQAVTPDVYAGRLPGAAISVINEGLRTGPVLVQVAQPGYAPVAVCGQCGALAHCQSCGGPVGFKRAGSAACRWCGLSVRQWNCQECDGSQLVQRGAGSERTAQQFSQQFPNRRVLVSDGDQPRERVDARPALVVSTPGAEPIAAGGYRAVVLLDAHQLLSRPTLRAGEDCLRWWENAAAKAASDGVCLIASGAGPVVHAFVTGNTELWLREELHNRAELRYPPMVRVASVSGTDIPRALEAISDIREHDVLGPTPTVSGEPRAIVRFSYTVGLEVAKRLRGVVVAEAAGRNRTAKRGRETAGGQWERLRLKFDDRSVFDEF